MGAIEPLRQNTDYLWHIVADCVVGDRELRRDDDVDENAFLEEIRKQYVLTARKGLESAACVVLSTFFAMR